MGKTLFLEQLKKKTLCFDILATEEVEEATNDLQANASFFFSYIVFSIAGTTAEVYVTTEVVHASQTNDSAGVRTTWLALSWL